MDSGSANIQTAGGSLTQERANTRRAIEGWDRKIMRHKPTVGTSIQTFKARAFGLRSPVGGLPAVMAILVGAHLLTYTDAHAAAPHAGVVIESAVYASPNNGRQLDVTQQLQSDCDAATHECTVSCNNQLAGDPDVGTPKVCQISYRCVGRRLQQLQLKEGQSQTLSCSVPGNLQPGASDTPVVSEDAYANATAVEFGAHRWPAAPLLSVNREPVLCARLKHSSDELFVSSAMDLDTPSAISREFDPVEGKDADPASADGMPSRLWRADVDLDGTGRRQVVVFRSVEQSWRGSWNYGYVFPSESAYESARLNVEKAWTSLPDEQYPSPEQPDLGAREFYPSALNAKGESIDTGDVWANESLFKFNDHYYLAQGSSGFDRLSPINVSIFRLHADGTVQLACTLVESGIQEAHQHFQALPAMSSLLATIRGIGAGGADSGTLHAGQMHDAQATAAEIRAASRPWATSSQQPTIDSSVYYYRYDERMVRFLELWSLEGLWNRREYQTLAELIPDAEDSYARYIIASFEVPPGAAHARAVKVTQQLIGARIEIPNQLNINAPDLYFPHTALHRAVMQRDREAFDAALANPQANHRGYFGQPVSDSRILGDALQDAVEWPYALNALLAAGADLNATNSFGKTALMMAAQFDRVDSVRALIKGGANVNAKTTAVTQIWEEGPKRTERTALMYAAENASPGVIGALLEAGADPLAKDSQMNGMEFYLANNPRYTQEERSLSVVGLAKSSVDWENPSFSCMKAKSASEKTICGSGVLRTFDAEIARAFRIWRAKEGDEALREQRSWLQHRDRECNGGNDADCMAEVMRTHLRYLFERTQEPGAS
jgi:uncharacterized protein YecT (DUF1311 family)